MQRTAIAVVGLVLAGWESGLLQAQVYRMNRDGTSVEELQEIHGLRVLVEKAQGNLLQLVHDTQDAEPARDREQPRGRGSIRGSVIAAATGAPIRGATVRATSDSSNGPPQNTVTDDNGAFEFPGLAAGRWRVTASKSGFVPRAFGQRGPSGSGGIVSVNEGATATASMALLRAGAIAGHVFDEFGDPAVGARVQAMQFEVTENGRRLVPAGVPDISDDTGAFRVYGLLPGDYLVSSRAPTPFDGDMFVVGDTERLIVTNAAANVRSIGGHPHATSSTFFPGTTDVSVADRVTIGAGDERTGVDFTLTKSPPLRVSGTVINSSGERPSGAVMVSLASDSLDMNATFGMSSPSVNGGFDFRDVPPGLYTLVASIPGVRLEMAELPLRVMEDITGLELVTAPGVALSGTVVSDTGTLPVLRGMTVRARPLSGQSRAFSATSGAVIDSVFQVPNLLGAFRIAIERIPAGWTLKAIEVDGVDVTDTTVTFKSGQRPQATVILTNRLTELSGVVTNDGKPVDADIAIFPDDPAKWTSTRFVRPLRAGNEGTFSLRGLPPHDSYLAIATDYLEPSELRDPEFIERLRSRATPFSLEEGQSRRIRLTFVERSAIDGR